MWYGDFFFGMVMTITFWTSKSVHAVVNGYQGALWEPDGSRSS